MSNGTDATTVFCIIFIAAIVAIALIAAVVFRLQGFLGDLRYIKMEISRTDGEERRYWKNEKRKLWLSLLPFYRG